MILGHNYLPVMDIRGLGPGSFTVTDITPTRLREWADTQVQRGITPTPDAVAAQRRFRAWGLGFERWDPIANKYMPPGWIRNIQERKEARHELLRDISDLVSGCALLLNALTDNIPRYQPIHSSQLLQLSL